jgi:hypothetical protein
LSGDEPGATGITQRELLMEMRDDIRALRSAVDSVARNQALSVERRAPVRKAHRRHAPGAALGLCPDGGARGPGGRGYSRRYTDPHCHTAAGAIPAATRTRSRASTSELS